MLCLMDAELFLIAGGPKFGDLLLLSVAMINRSVGVLNNVGFTWWRCTHVTQGEPTQS